jgi:hypothetical protein
MIGLEVIECPYMPEGFIALKDAVGLMVLNIKTGIGFRLPEIRIDVGMPTEFKVTGDTATGFFPLRVQFGWCGDLPY